MIWPLRFLPRIGKPTAHQREISISTASISTMSNRTGRRMPVSKANGICCSTAASGSAMIWRRWSSVCTNGQKVKAILRIKLPPSSYSSHAAWEQCPRKMWHSYIARDVEREESNALRWGNYVHEALEKHINGSEALPDNLQHHRHLYTFPAG